MTPELIKQWAKESGFIFANDAKLDNHAQWQANVFTKFAALVAAHQRELDAKDGERYRTIRSQNWNDGEFCVVMRPRENVRLGALCPSGAQLDDLVDAAAIRGTK